MENQDYSQNDGAQPIQHSPNAPAVGTASYWDDNSWDEDAVSPTPRTVSTTSNEQPQEAAAEETVSSEAYEAFEGQVEAPRSEVSENPVPAPEPLPTPPPFEGSKPVMANADVEGIYEAVNSVFEKVEKFQDIIKIQNKTIDRFSKGLIMEARKPLLMELCDLYETVMFGIQEDDKAVSERFTAEERCRILRAKLDELLQFVQCTLEDNQVEIKNHPKGTDELAPYQTVTGREMTTDAFRFADFDSTTNAIYVTDRCGFVVKSTEVSESGACKMVDHILRPEEVTKVVLIKD